tara:strand:- start:686 stop:1012 length:327 start_codon:yes stop_codon:yes gene_type:complete
MGSKMENLTSVLLENGALGIFAAFLVYNYFQQMKRLDELSEKYMSHIEILRKEFKDDVDLVRTRYDRVIERYDKERDEQRVLFERSLEHIRLKLDSILTILNRFNSDK